MLTDKQDRFAREYIIDLNATQAAIRAGYSVRNAARIGSETMAVPAVQARVAELMWERAERTDLSADRVIAEIAAMALWDPVDLAHVKSPEDFDNLPERVRRAVVGWGWDRNGRFTMKLADKGRALDQLMRHFGEYNDKIDVSVTDALGDRLARAKARLEHGN